MVPERGHQKKVPWTAIEASSNLLLAKLFAGLFAHLKHECGVIVLLAFDPCNAHAVSNTVKGVFARRNPPFEKRWPCPIIKI